MIVIRDMVQADVEQVAKTEQENFSAPWGEEAFLERITNKNAYYLVAEDEGNIIGTCGLRNIVGEGEITNVVVTRHNRNKGIAYEMLCKLIEVGGQAGIKAYTLEVRESNVGAIHLYEKLGFAAEGKRRNFYQDPQEDAVIMWKR